MIQAKTIHISSFKYFYPERPRLLHVNQPLFESLSQNSAWVAEPKYNGSRLQFSFQTASCSTPSPFGGAGRSWRGSRGFS